MTNKDILSQVRTEIESMRLQEQLWLNANHDEAVTKGFYKGICVVLGWLETEYGNIEIGLQLCADHGITLEDLKKGLPEAYDLEQASQTLEHLAKQQPGQDLPKVPVVE